MSAGASVDSPGEADNDDSTEKGRRSRSRFLKKEQPPMAPAVVSTHSQDSDHIHGQLGRGSQSKEHLAGSDSGHGQLIKKEKHSLHGQELLQQDKVPDEYPAELTRMVGYLTQYALKDWTLVLEVCDRASTSEDNAKEAVRALRREFKYGKPPAQLSAARLWAVMLRNSSDVFIVRSTCKKFLGTIKNLLQSNETSPVVRERLLDVVAAAAYASDSKGPNDRGFKGLWRRVKPPNKPDEGAPFDTNDAIFNPPDSDYTSRYTARDQATRPRAGTNNSDSPTYTGVATPATLTPSSQTRNQPPLLSLEKTESLLLPMTFPVSSRPLPVAATFMPCQLAPSTDSVPEPQELPSETGTQAPPPFELNTPATPPPRYSQLFGVDSVLGEYQYSS